MSKHSWDLLHMLHYEFSWRMEAIFKSYTKIWNEKDTNKKLGVLITWSINLSYHQENNNRIMCENTAEKNLLLKIMLKFLICLPFAYINSFSVDDLILCTFICRECKIIILVQNIYEDEICNKHKFIIEGSKTSWSVRKWKTATNIYWSPHL